MKHLILLALFVFTPIAAHAGITTVTVSDAAELADALFEAESDANDTVITLEAGLYKTQAAFGTFTYDSTLNKSLTLEGAGMGQTILDAEAFNRAVAISHHGTGGRITFSKMTVQNGLAKTGSGGGIFIIADNADIAVEEMEFKGNILEGGSHGGGFFLETLDGKVRVTRCLLTDNHASDIFSTGGGGFVYASDRSEITNNVFYKNTATNEGGGLEAENANVYAFHNTFVENTAGNKGGGLFVDVFAAGSSGNVYNNVFLGNAANGAGETGDDLFLENAGLFAVPGEVFNNIFTQACYHEGCDQNATEGVTTGNNSGQNPLLINPAAGDFRLGLGSPAVDAGTATTPLALPAVDFSGAVRIFGAAPDLGALEALPSFQLSTQNLQFGNVAPGATATQNITIENQGAGPLSVSAVDLDNAQEFSLNVNGGSQPCGAVPFTVTGGETCTMSVGFLPSSEGPASATIEFVGNDPANPTLNLALAGTGDATAGGNGTSNGGGCRFRTSTKLRQRGSAVISLALMFGLLAIRITGSWTRH